MPQGVAKPPHDDFDFQNLRSVYDSGGKFTLAGLPSADGSAASLWVLGAKGKYRWLATASSLENLYHEGQEEQKLENICHDFLVAFVIHGKKVPPRKRTVFNRTT